MKQLKILLLLSIITTTALPHKADANTLDFLFGSGSFGRKSGGTGDCRNIIRRIGDNRAFYKDETWKSRVVTERTPSFLNDVEFLEENIYANQNLAVVDTRFLKEFDTRFYYTSTARPNPDGTIPMVDPAAKALVIYFHGSGTAKASGGTFAMKMNSLSKMGYSTVSFDLPFHSDGSRNPALANSKEFSDYIDRIVTKLKQPGQPVILVGHSFGPDVIAEYITQHPHSVDSAVLISPGGFDKTTAQWYKDKTSKMNFGDFEPNNDGGMWASRVTQGKTWSNPKAPGRVDPTIANPKLKVFVISGDKEEYVPGELGADGFPTDKPRDYDVAGAFQKYFHKVDVTIEPGVGHLIFKQKDAQGQDVVLRSVLKANGDSLLNEKELKKAAQTNKTTVDQFAGRYSKDLFFRNWVDSEAKKSGHTGPSLLQQLVKTEDKGTAQKFISDFNVIEKQRLDEAYNNIKKTQEWAPAFYNENKALIEVLGEKGADANIIVGKYIDFLKTQKPEVVAAHSRAPASVFIVPEKVAPVGQKSPEELEKIKQMKLKKKQEAQEKNQEGK